jgi:hypothetical protein
MTNKPSKCTIVFSVGVTISLASMAFFNQMMNMPSKAMQMGQQFVAPQPQNQPCNCACIPAIK